MSALLNTSGPADTSIRSDAAAAWRAVGSSSARHTMIRASEDGRDFVGLIHEDAAPGTICYDEHKRPVMSRPRVSLDDALELVTDPSRSARHYACDDAPLGDRARDQLRDMRRSLAVLDPRKFSVSASADARGVARSPFSDATVARDIVKRYGVDNLPRLQQLVGLAPELARTVSRLAAADDMTDLFIGSELIVGAPDIIRVEHRRPYARELLPMRSLNAPGALAYESQSFDRRGKAEHTTNFRGRAPTATVSRAVKIRPLVWLRAGMSWSWMEIQQWMQARSNGAPLPDFVREQQDAAREATLELENIDLLFGNETFEIQGLLSAANGIPGLSEAATTNLVNLADGEARVAAILAGAKTVFETELEEPEFVAMGTRDYVYASTTAYDSSNPNGETVLEVALKRGKLLGVKAIVRIPELGYSAEVKTYLQGLGYDSATAEKYAGGVGALAVIATLTRNPRKMRGIIGQDLMQLPPDRTSTETSVQVCMSTGGVEVLVPRAMYIRKMANPA